MTSKALRTTRCFLLTDNPHGVQLPTCVSSQPIVVACVSASERRATPVALLPKRRKIGGPPCLLRVEYVGT